MTATKCIGFERIIAFALLAAGLSVAVIGLLDLLGWLLDMPVLTRWQADSNYMAPSTAVLFVMFGATLCLCARLPRDREAVLLITLFGVIGFMAALTLLALRIQGVFLPAELLGLRITGTFAEAPIGYISPITAFCLLLSYGSLLASLPYGARGAWRGWVMLGFGGLVSLVSFVLILTHLFGIPLVLGKTKVPTAFNTCISLLVMGLAQMVLALRYTRRPTASSDADGVRLLPYALTFLVFATGICAATYYFYHETELKFRQEVESQLLIVSQLKTDELVRWRRERLWDGSLTQNAATTSAVRELLKTPDSMSAQRQMQDLLGEYQRLIGYDRAFLLDANGVTRISVPQTAEPTAAILARSAAASMRTGQVILQDFYRDEHDQRVYLALLVPILDKQDGNQPLGVIVLRIDPTIYLYPHIKSWPTPSATAETLLVQREGNDVLFLNDLRFRADAALALRLPLTGNSELPAVKAVLGQSGIVDGVDYRGAPVIAAVGAVQDSPWYIVTRIDTEEVYSPLRTRMWLALLLVSILVCGAGIVLVLLWRQQRMRFYQRQFELTTALRESEELHQGILRTAMDGFCLIDTHGRILEVNDAYCRMCGYSEQELLSMRVADLESLESAEDIIVRLQNVRAQGNDRFESQHRSKDGSKFAVEASMQYLPYKDGRFVVFLQDITERKQAEEVLRNITQKYQTLFDSSRDALMLLMPPSWKFTGANPASLQLFGVSSEAEFITLGPWEISPEYQPDGRPSTEKAKEMIATAMREGSHFFDWEHQRLDGHRFPCDVLLTRIEIGEKQCLQATVRDITQRKQAEEALRRSEEHLRLSQVYGGIGTWEADLISREEYWSEAVITMLGFPPLEKPTWDDYLAIILPEDRQRVVDTIKAHLDDNIKLDVEYRILANDGRIRWIRSVGQAERDADGTPLRLRGIGQDITESKQAEEALRLANERFRRFVDSNIVGIAIATFEGTILEANDYYLNLTGYSRQELEQGKVNWRAITPPEYRPADEQAIRELRDEGVCAPYEKEYLRRDGSKVPVFLTGALLPGPGEQIAAFYLDITERKQAEEKLRLAASVFTQAREGIMITATNGEIIDVNDAFCDITGYSREEVLGENPRIFKSDRHLPEFYAEMWRDLIEQGQWQGELWNRRKNGEVHAVMPTISAVRDEQGNTRCYVALYSDITLLKDHEQELERSAHFDILTNLPNRVLLADRLQQGMVQTRRREQQLAVAFLDLDGFKAINDNYGHEAGDQLLITLAKHMKQALREGDTLARLGGDEFVAVLADTGDIEACEPMLTRLLAAASEPVQLGEITLQVSASLGVTFYPQSEDIDADQLLRQADQAMYQAKQAGKNRYHIFDAEQDSRIRSRYENLEHIRCALDAGEFVLYYQPKVNMRTGTVIGAEALIRWQHPEKGLLPPDQFLPAIEDHLLGIELGEWVIETALLQMESWQAAGLNIPVSINISAHHLQQENFAGRLQALLAAHPTINPGDVELEVLETQAMEDLFKVSRVIEACRNLGVGFALDDFGTGYSSLSYLKHLPVTQLKIDHTFVRDMIDDPDDLSIVEGVIGLGTAFRLLIVAEGAETVEHSTILLQLGCDVAQGYGIARPMPAHQLPGWEATWRPDQAWSESPPLGRGDLLLLFACIEHRAWIAAIEHYLRSEREAPLPLDIHQCRFGQWLNTDGLARFGAQPLFQDIDRLHREVHILAAELCKLHEQDRKQEALARLPELHDLRDALLEQMKLVKQSHQ